MEKITYWIFCIAIILATLLFIKGCNPAINSKPIVTKAIISAPTKEEIKDYNAKSVIHIDEPKNIPLGKKAEIKIIETNDKKTIQVIEFKNEFRTLKNFGPYADFGLTGLGGGLKLTLIGYGRFNLDGLVGWPRCGAGINYQLYKNSYLGISYNYSFKAIQEPALYFTLNF